MTAFAPKARTATSVELNLLSLVEDSREMGEVHGTAHGHQKERVAAMAEHDAPLAQLAEQVTLNQAHCWAHKATLPKRLPFW
jgi:hypothetical protein